jgi:hypothetical protein
MYLIANDYGISVVHLAWSRLLFGAALSLAAALVLMFVGGLITAFALMLTLALVERRRASTLATLKSTTNSDRAKLSMQTRVRTTLNVLLATILALIVVLHVARYTFNVDAFVNRTLFVLVTELVHLLTIRMLCHSFHATIGDGSLLATMGSAAMAL